MIIWFTGQPGAGKSTLAEALSEALRKCGGRVARIDGEELRRQTGNADYSDAGRILNVTTGQDRAAKLAADGLIVIASFVSPHRTVRERFKQRQDVLEVYVHNSNMTSKNAFHVAYYEPPLTHYVDVDTSSSTVMECVRIILDSYQLALKRAPA